MLLPPPQEQATTCPVSVLATLRPAPAAHRQQHADTWDSGGAHDSGEYLKRRLERRCVQQRQKQRGESPAL
jgi:hypothetical protein